MIHRITILRVNIDLLRIILTRFEFRHVFETVDHVTRSRRDTANSRFVLFGDVAVLLERVAAADGTVHWGRWIDCKRFISMCEVNMKCIYDP